LSSNDLTQEKAKTVTQPGQVTETKVEKAQDVTTKSNEKEAKPTETAKSKKTTKKKTKAKKLNLKCIV